uniref:Respiratory burst oxidase protein B n=1 Tax=Arundo donax TaxID=35708 RepID=A0A0A9GG29_ARUDO
MDGGANQLRPPRLRRLPLPLRFRGMHRDDGIEGVRARAVRHIEPPPADAGRQDQQGGAARDLAADH